MKFLLTAVNAKYIHSNLAIYSLRAYSIRKEPALEEHMELAEYTINQPFRRYWRTFMAESRTVSRFPAISGTGE